MAREANLATVYAAIKDGSIIEKIDSFSSEDLQPFLPLLIFASLSTYDGLSPEAFDTQDKLRSRLMGFVQCNTLVQMADVNVSKVLSELKSMSSEQGITPKGSFKYATPYDKVKTVAWALLQLSSLGNNDSAMTDSSFFGCEYPIDELVCAILTCIRKCPARFDIHLIISSMLPLSNAPELITQLLCNMGESMESVVEYLISAQFPESSPSSKQRAATLLKLMSVDRYLINRSLVRILGSHKNNALALSIMCICLDDSELLTWLLSALLKHHPIAAFIRRPRRPAVKLLHERIAEVISSLSARKGNSEDEARLAQLLGALRVVANVQLSVDESRSWALFLTRTECEDERYICMALSVLVACPQLIPAYGESDREVEESVVAFFDWLKTRLSSDCSPTLQQFFLLLSIHLHANQTTQLSKLISNVLYFKVKLDTNLLSRFRNLFLRHAMTERELAQLVSSLPVTGTLTIAHKGFLPAHCVAQLLTARSFAKHSIPIHEWLASQIVECRSPVHPTVVELIAAYASSCVPEDTNLIINEPLSEKFIQDLFIGDIVDEVLLVPRLLSFFFMLSLRSKIEKSDPSNSITYPYNLKMESRLPIRYMISVISSRPDDFQALRSPLLRVAAHFYVYMLPDANFLLYDLNVDLSTGSERSAAPLRESGMEHSLESVCAESTAEGVHRMKRLEWSSLRTQLRSREYVLNAMRLAVKREMSDPFVTSLTHVWNRIENVESVTFLEETVTALSGEKITHEMLCEQPLLLCRCKDIVFKSGPLFSCFLRLLSFYESAGRNILAHKLQTAPLSSSNRQEQKAEREELARSLIGAQNSELVQVLLEACWRFGDAEVQKLACEHIHQMFIADPVLLKLVHFQGYPVEMIPMAVRLIPSMHICLDFVHEILALADMSKRLFAVVLITELAQMYRIEHSCIRVDLVLDVLWTLCRVLPCDEIFPLLTGVVPALARILTIFPQISDDVTYVLKGISRIATSRIVVSSTVLKPASCPERRLIAEIDKVIANQGNTVSYKRYT
uniref:Integrator complex subunit 2 n=1 Tax=Ascaris suum TaxID=6253 RepID=F1KSB2_ASCSU